MAEELWATWEGGQLVGDDRPITRAIISKVALQKWRETEFRTLLFSDSFIGINPETDWLEIPNIQTVSIDQRLGSDAQSMTMTLLNNVQPVADDNLDLTHAGGEPLKNQPSRRDLKDLGRPGQYTFGRGTNLIGAENVSFSLWGHDVDPAWVDMLIPNRLIRTFQGYGTDGATHPTNDTKLIMTGTWLIDKVDFGADGRITVQTRDLAKLLIEQRLYPPIIPLDHYPLTFTADHTVDRSVVTVPGMIPGEPEVVGDDVGGHVSSGWDSSVAPWYGHNGSVFGHTAFHAFDDDLSTYWLSVGNNSPTAGFSFEWIESNTGGNPVNRVRFKPKWGGYTVYVSVKVGGTWQGINTIPYAPGSIGKNQSDKPYILKQKINATEDWVTIDFGESYQADRVRLTFTDLHDSGLGSYTYRAAIYEMQVVHVTAATEPVAGDPVEEEITDFIKGNLRNNDYTDIIKVLCAWAGFYWPYGETDDLLVDWSGNPADMDEGGRVWGDFMYSGAYPVEPPEIPPSFWDNKSIMDGINQIKEILGFIFYIDASGGVVWRSPNIWKSGNFITGTGYVGSDSVRDVRETQVLLDAGVSLNDENLRSEIVVVSSEDPSLYGSYVPSFSSDDGVPSAVSDLDLLGGQERVMLVPNYPFLTQQEVNKFAYLVSLWIHWSYRKTKFRIPGNPAIEPDDQIRITERVTSETFSHYILGVNSTMDMTAGTWFMDIDTHWLGNGPDDAWMVKYQDMTPALYAYLVAIGQISDDVDPSSLPDDFFRMPVPDVPTDPIRVDDDYAALFPDLPSLLLPPDGWSSEFQYDLYGNAGEVAPSSGSGGVAYNASEAGMLAYWGNPCSGQTRKKITFMRAWDPSFAGTNSHPDQPTDETSVVNTKAVRAFIALGYLFADEGFVVNRAGTYNCRRISCGSPTCRWSNHAWATAMDVNSGDYRPDYNGPFGPGDINRYLSTKNQGEKMLNVGVLCSNLNIIRTGNHKQVFRWGGRWTSLLDPMHFEIVATPQDLATGIYYKNALLGLPPGAV